MSDPNNKKSISNYLKVNLIITFSCWLLLWCVAMFIELQWLNPVQWVIDIPSSSDSVRFLWVFFSAIYLVLSGVLYSCIKDGVFKSTPAYVPKPRPQHMQSTSSKSLDAVDIAVGVGTGIVGAEIVTDILGLDD